ncbi:glycyl radical protein [Deferribacteraceae bacterium V6Fe1]|nr:glycyl radical protein [Deferribacteraceae bacterium V6Fe1]
MNERVKKLRRLSLETKETFSFERAKLLTDFYKSVEGKKIGIAVKRGMALKYILENKTIYIGENELIVGERGECPKATSSYPEISLHSLGDLQILNSREKLPYKVSEEAFKIYEEEIIPYWEGKTIREEIFEKVSDDWKRAYKAGIFTEFMEQRAPGHTVADGKIYDKGLKDFIQDIENKINSLDKSDPYFEEKLDELSGMKIAAEGVILYAKRHAKKALELAEKETDEKRRAELLNIAKICEYVPENRPRNIYEALQHYWFIHLGVITELNGWDAFSPGRLDLNLYPFYKNDIESGRFTKEEIKELLECFWVKFNNHPAPPKVGVTAEESSTYTDFAQINFGGLNVDGQDAVNELSFLLLDVVEEMRIVQPNASVHISRKNPDSFLKRALEVVRTGFGQPAIFNADAVMQELLRQGKDIVDARLGGTSGCVESGAFGKENYTLTGYFNLVKVLEITLNNGIDPVTGERIGVESGDFENFESFEDLLLAFEKQLKYFLDIKIKGNLVIEEIYAKKMPAPFLSILIDDCIDNAKDYNAGGARYNSSYIQGVGIGTITDSLSALKEIVFEKKLIPQDKVLKILSSNFEGYEVERLILKNKTKKYGNDEPYADEIMKKVFEMFFGYIDGKPNYKGGQFRINMLPTTVHVYFGSVIGATFDGRKAFEPLSEGISPVQGSDINGPTAVIKSASKMDHLKTGGTLLNMKVTPSLIKDEKGLNALSQLVRTYFKFDGHHIQFNVIDAATLKKAKESPEDYRDLIVRVAGYSDYFCNLNEKLKNEIIERTEHEVLA